MAEYAVIAATALAVSGLTLFSGFGLGTVLMPVFALFFPVPVAIAATAVVHLANNLFKVGLIGRQADWGAVLRFGLPAALAAILGARLLAVFAGLPPLATYHFAGAAHEVSVLKLTVGLLIVAFASLELSSRLENLAVPPRLLILGGLISGFFGGLTGNQGAFRTAFLIKAGLTKEAFIGTGVVSTVIVDTVRLVAYGLSFYTAQFAALDRHVLAAVAVGTASAFLGAWLGARLLKKVTLRFVQILVAAMMIALGLALAAGIA
ncbi:MAG: sulfite exporter TauE/SafE family protein [Alphaproteobacteria bacterium]|nr:sulfite exporter TauE/SafE family protein [Alphaproteobacteria bacterium]